MKHLILGVFLFLHFFCLGSTKIAITIDDHPQTSGIFDCYERTKILIKTLGHYNIKAVFFCIGENCKNDQNLLTYVNDHGHFLSNHSFSHRHSSELSLQEFETEIRKTEEILKSYKKMRKWFRYPYLDYGNRMPLGGAQEKAIALYNLLKKCGYSEGYVTINTFDWHINTRLQKAFKEGNLINYDKLRNMYVSLVKNWCIHYIDLYKNYGITHTLLLHANDLNALYLSDILEMIKKSGWKIVSPKNAFSDVAWREKIIFGNNINTAPPSLDCDQIDQLIDELNIFSDSNK